LAGYADRVAAAAIDWAGPGLVAVLVHLPVDDPPVPAPVRLLVVAASVGWVVWNGVRQGRTGMSVGKERVGIRLVDRRTAAVVGPGRSVLRWVARLLDLVPLGAGLLLPLVDPARQTVADKVVGTVVLEGRTPAPIIG
jgi:uncharacterized RDD family membrane protein YckC